MPSLDTNKFPFSSVAMYFFNLSPYSEPHSCFAFSLMLAMASGFTA